MAKARKPRARKANAGRRPERRQDPRLTATRISAMDGEPVSEETWAMVVSPVRLDGGEVLMMPAPQVVAFNLVTAKLRGEQGTKERRKITANLTRAKDGNLRVSDPRKAMDCIEDLTSTILFAYAALEGFGNHYIDLLDPATTVTVKRRGEDVELSQPDMVARLSTSEKLDLAVPLVTGRSSPKGTAPWADFVTLRRLRDAIVHPKNRGASSDADDPGIYALLMRGDGDSAAETAVNLVLVSDPGFLPEHVLTALRDRPSART